MRIQHLAETDDAVQKLVRAAVIEMQKRGRGAGLFFLNEATELVGEFLQLLAVEALKGHKVQLPKLGTFYRGTQKARRVRNPATRELMELPPSFALKFRAARAQKGKING